METLKILQAFDGKLIKELPFDSWATVDAALDTMQAIHKDRSRWLPAWQRIQILEKISAGIEREHSELSLLIAQEGGKPLRDARIEVTRAASTIRACAAEIAAMHGDEIPMDLSAAGAGRIAFTQKEPIGPVAAICAFNHPLNLITHQVGPAIATGCPVLIKPALTTPLSCLRFIEIAYAAGLPQEFAKPVIIGNETAERLVTDPRVAFFSFIGSDRVGWSLRSKLSPGTRFALEHGGAAPVIIDTGADLDAAIPSIVKGGYYHAGQVCVSAQRIFIHHSEYGTFRDRFVAAVKALKTGDPSEADTDVGPLILPREVERVHNWVNEARDMGAIIATGGEPISDYVYAPTVIENPPFDAKVSAQEIFGPVTCLYSYDNVDEAISRANDLPVAFQAAVYSGSLDSALAISRKLSGSAVMINDHTAFRVDWMPFAGLKRSGYGTGGVKYSMADMVTEKMTVIKSPVI